MKFTSKKVQNQSFSFLDVKISRESRFTTSVYCKPTFSGVYTHSDSYMPITYKFGLISTIIFRSFTICSDMTKFHQEICKVKEIFLKNGYKNSLLTNVLRHFLTNYSYPKRFFKQLRKKM